MIENVGSRQRPEASESNEREPESLYRALFDNAADAIVIHDMGGKFLEVNPVLCERLGYSREELLQMTPVDISSPEYAAIVQQRVETLRKAGHAIFETVHVRRDGTTIPIEASSRIIEYKGRPAVLSIARDITERKRAEEALRESEEKYRALFEKIPQSVYQSSPDGKLLTANPALVQMLGYASEAELLAADIAREFYVKPEDRDTWIRKLEEQGELRDVELLLKRKDGQELTVLDNAHVVRDGQGTVLYYEGTLTDITERKRMQNELRRYSMQLERLVLERTRKLAESERRFRETVDLLPQIVFEIDESGNLTFLNRVALTLTGYSKEDLQAGLNALQLYSPQDRERRNENVKRLIAGETLGSNEYLLQRKDGSTFPAIVHSAPIVHENKSVGLRGIAVDITERKQMEEELRSARERLEHVISANPAVIYTGRPRPDFSDFDATYMSRSVVSLLGLEPVDLIGHPEIWYDRVHPQDLNRYYAELPLLWREGQHTFEYRFLHKDGAYRWIREEARVIRDAAGKPVEVLGYWSDITGERQVEEMRDRFMSAVTHELRTPLVSIKGYLDLVLTGESGPIASEVKSNLEVVKRNTDRLTSLTDDLLDIQRLQSGKLQVNLEPVDLREIIEHAASEIKPFTKAKKQRFKVAVPRKTLPILGDPVRLSQVLMNLLGNASKFTSEGGEIRLMVKDAKEMIVVKVADTGIGIRKEDLSRVFEPFAVIRKPAHIKGTGLGLSVTKGLVEAHTGKIWAESPGEGKGSTFVFALLKRVVK
jgi:PAS domain S-box-containing protein